MGAVTDPRDIRTMIPRTRRAIDGPAADSPASLAATLTDNQVKDVIADALANVILYTGGVFGKTLEVTATDPHYAAPSEFRTNSELSLQEQSVVIAQAALDYHLLFFRDRKTAETIANEAQNWDYEFSATVIVAHIKALQAARDKALEIVAQENGATLDSYESFLGTRDAATSLAVEPWVRDVHFDVPGAMGGYQFDISHG